MAGERRTIDIPRRGVWLRRVGLFLGIALIPFVVLLFALAAMVYVAWALLLRFLVLLLWIPRGHRVLVIYSDSPSWKPYFEERILPRLEPHSVVLNWSERRRWSFSLARCLFWFYGGDKANNPLVVVMRPFRRAQVFRFWGPLRDAKHGRTEPLQKLERELFDVVQATVGEPSPRTN